MMKILLFFMLILISISSFSETYYVSSSNGDDQNSGSDLFPWQTLQKVNSVVFNPGDSILFHSGDTWMGQLIIPASGRAVLPLYFGSYGIGELPVIDGTGYSSAIKIDSKEFVCISSLEVKSGNHCILINGAMTGDILLKNLTVHDPQQSNCISISERSNVTVSDSKIFNSANAGGIAAYRNGGFPDGWNSLVCHNIRIENCEIYNNHQSGIYIAGHNAQIKNNTVYNNGSPVSNVQEPAYHNIYYIGDNGVVEGNVLSNSPGGNGLRFEGSNLLVTRNFIKENAEHGISLSNDFPDTLTNNRISYNIIVGGSSGYGILTYASGSGLFENTYIYNNTIYASTSGFSGLGLFNGKNIYVKNNIVSVVDNSLRMSSSVAASLVSDYNCFFSEREDLKHLYNPGIASPNITFSDWQALGYDAHSIDKNPIFVNASPDTDSDFRLLYESPCVNAGVDLGLNSDYFNLSIDALPEIGACEYDKSVGNSTFFEISQNLKVFPNPASDKIFVENYGGVFISEIEILNVFGQKIISLNINKDYVSINVNDLPEGIYVLVLKDVKGFKLIRKFSKK